MKTINKTAKKRASERKVTRVTNARADTGRRTVSNKQSTAKIEGMPQIFEYTLIVAGVSDITAALEDSLFEAGCDDALLGKRNGAIYLDFAREAASFSEAILTSLTQIEQCGMGLTVVGIEPSPYVTQSEIARRLDTSRESIRLLAEGQRHQGLFPPPQAAVKTQSPLWNWSMLLAQVEELMEVNRDTCEQASALLDIYLALEIRQNKARMPNVQLILNSIGADVALPDPTLGT